MMEQVKQLGRAIRGKVLGELHGHAFSTECESAHRHLQWLIKEVGIDLPTEEIDVTYHQLKNKEIVISIHGRHNCGKTTVINALLGHSLLPMSIFNETGVTVRIEHDGTVHEGKCSTYPNGCQHCPKLTSNAGESIQGCENICERLEKVNEEVRTTKYQASGQRVKYEFTLTTNVPVLAGAQGGWKVIMLDNPGFGESHQEHMTRHTKTTLKTSSAYLVIMDVGQLGDEEDERCLKLIHEGDRGAFDVHGRVLVAVTKYDSMYQERPTKRKSEEEIKKLVQQNVKAATGSYRGISDDAIVLVCGKWALHARLLQRDPDDVHSQQIVKVGLSLVDAPSGQMEDPIQNKGIIMEGRTKIKELESKLQEMVSRCAYIWIDTMTANYQRYIKAGLDMLTPKLEEKKEHLRDTEAVSDQLMRYYTEATNLRAYIQSSMQQQSAVYEQLRRNARHDVQATKKSVVQLVQDFGLRCARRFNEDTERQYGERELRRDITRLLDDEVKPTIVVEICNASEKFCETVQCERIIVRDVDNYINSMREEAQKYIQLRPECQYLPIVVHVEGVAAAQPMGNEEERSTHLGGLDAVCNKEKPTFEDLQQHLDIPALRFPWFDELRRFLHRHFPRMFDAPGRIDRSNVVAQIVDQLQEKTGAIAEEYLKDFEKVVADFFFQKYCQFVHSKVEDFEKQLGEKLDNQKRNDDRQVVSLRAEVKQLEEKKTELVSNQSKIAKKAEECIRALRSTSRPVSDPHSLHQWESERSTDAAETAV